MKKVRYAIGAAGAIPALAAMAAPAAAAPQAPAARTTKTVSLQHTVTAGYCTGAQQATAKTVSAKVWFWHTFSPTYDTSCIGTVDMSFIGAVQNASSVRLRIWDYSLGGAHKLAYQHWSHKSQGHYFTDGVHRAFGYVPVEVCAAAINTNTSQIKQGPVCKSVG
jgi:hypothetical protein